MQLSNRTIGFLYIGAVFMSIRCTDSTDAAETDTGFSSGTDSDLPLDTDTISPSELGIEWISIAAGTFEMGSESGTYREIPVHTVTVPGFEMMKTEVTLQQFERCVFAGACEESKPPWDTPLYQEWCNSGHSDRGLHPINCVDWYNADTFCAWIGARLPSEAEWEYAARSQGQVREYPWGNETATCGFAVMDYDNENCEIDSTQPVCSKPLGATDQGLCDMAGNVYEYVADEYHDNYDGAPIDGSAWISGDTYNVILRGGSWWSVLSEDLRVSARVGYVPDTGSQNAGFRCARSLF